MAEFCQQCSIEIFQEDLRELADNISKADVEKGFGVHMLCEGCGPAWVDHNGKCMSDHCLKEHGKEEGNEGD